MEHPFKKEIEAAAKKRNLDPALVAAIAAVESSFKPDALRYESKFQKKYIDPHPFYQFLDPETRTLLSSSLGLMQVMGVVAHEDGLPIDRLKDLLRVDNGLEYGCKQLWQLFQRYSLVPNVISAYNAGSARKGKGGKYTNQGYVDKVLRKLEEYKNPQK